MKEKGRQTRLLAAVAILAMVVCAFAVAMPSESVEGALPTPSPQAGVSALPEDNTIALSANTTGYYFVDATGEAGIEITINGNGSAASTALNLYIYGDADVEITIGSVTAGLPSAINIYAASATPATGATTVNYYPGLMVAFTGDAAGETATVSNVTSTTNAAIAVVAGATLTAGPNTCGISFANATNTIYYATGSNIADGVITLDAADESVTITDGTAVVASTSSTSTGIIAKITASSASSNQNDTVTITGADDGNMTVDTNTGGVAALTSGSLTYDTYNTIDSVSFSWANFNSTTSKFTFYADKLNTDQELSSTGTSFLYIYDIGTNAVTVKSGDNSISIAANTSFNTVLTIDVRTGFLMSGAIDYSKIRITAGNAVVSTGTDASAMEFGYAVIGSPNNTYYAEGLSGTSDNSGSIDTVYALSSGSIIVKKVAAEVTLADDETLNDANHTFTLSADFASAEGLKIAKNSGFTFDGSYDAGVVTLTKGTFTLGNTNMSTGPLQLNGSAALYANADGVTTTVTAFIALENSRSYFKGTQAMGTANTNYIIGATATVMKGDTLVEPTATSNITDAGDLVTAIKQGLRTINVGGNITITATDVGGDGTLTITEGTVINLGNNTLTIASGVNLQIVKGTINSESGKIIIQKGATFDINMSDVYAVVSGNGYINVSAAKSETFGGQSSGTRDVGYGNTIVINGSYTLSSFNDFDVYGTLQVDAPLTISFGADVTVYETGSLVLNSSMNVAGNVTVNGKMTLNSGASLTVSGSANQNASFTVNERNYAQEDDYGVLVGSGATFSINSGITSGSSYYTNTLTVNKTGSSFSGKGFIVEGTANINGTLVGAIEDKGTVSFSGIAGNAAEITVYDGITLSVSAVTSGTLVVNDAGAATDAASGVTGAVTSDGNSVSIAGVRGITVSVAVTDSVSQDGQNRYFWSDMTVSGTTGTDATATGSASIIINSAAALIGDTGAQRTARISVGDMSLAKYVALNLSGGDVYVVGALTGGQDTSVTIGTGAEVTVEGTITLSNTGAIANVANLNAAYYITQTTGTENYQIHNYATFDAAIENIANAYNDRVVVYGDISAKADATVPAAHTLEVTSGSSLTVDAGVTLTVANGAYASNSGVIEVKGKMVYENWGTAGTNTAPVSDVLVIAEPTRTYLSLAQAIDDQMTSITLNRDVTVEEDMTIPAGTTVSSDRYNVIVEEKVTLTVAGSLELPRSELRLADAANERNDAELVVTGNVIVGTEEPAGYLSLEEVTGAHFTKRVNGIARNFISSVEYAAANTDDSVTAIVIYGSVTAGDVTFTKADRAASLTISVMDGTDFESAFSFGTITLVGSTYIAGASSTGTVTAVYGDGTSSTSVDLNNVTGATLSSGKVETAAGTVNHLYLGGLIYEGTATVSEGTATVGELYVLNGTIGTGNDRVVCTGSAVIASGATLVVPEDAMLTAVGIDSDDVVVTVEGTLDIDAGTFAICGTVDVAGTMNVTDSGNTAGVFVIGSDDYELGEGLSLNVNGALNIVGSLNIDETDGEEGKVTVSGGVLVVGEKPETLGAGGAVSGPVTTTSNGYVKAYAGADMTDAKIDWNAATNATNANVTAFHINDALYMTVYTSSNTLEVYDVVYAEEFELRGVVNGLYYSDGSDSNTGLYANKAWFYDPSMAENRTVPSTGRIAQYDDVYASAEAATVNGTVSEGTGFTLFIDGVPVSNAYGAGKYPLLVGTHTVSYDVIVGYSGENASLTFNGQAIESGATIEITADMDTFTIAVTGATPADLSGGSSDPGLGLTDYLLIILVVLIVVMAIMVALRLMRS